MDLLLPNMDLALGYGKQHSGRTERTSERVIHSGEPRKPVRATANLTQSGRETGAGEAEVPAPYKNGCQAEDDYSCALRHSVFACLCRASV